jgi:hypothetical protein
MSAMHIEWQFRSAINDTSCSCVSRMPSVAAALLLLLLAIVRNCMCCDAFDPNILQLAWRLLSALQGAFLRERMMLSSADHAHGTALINTANKPGVISHERMCRVATFLRAQWENSSKHTVPCIPPGLSCSCKWPDYKTATRCYFLLTSQLQGECPPA